MALSFRVEPSSGVPTYLQIVRQVEDALRLGRLSVGDRLPTVRDVVADTAINPNTVSKAYRELEHRGLTTARAGQGTFITSTPQTVPLAEQELLRRDLERWLIQARAAGLDDKALSALFTASLRELAQSAAS